MQAVFSHEQQNASRHRHCAHDRVGVGHAGRRADGAESTGRALALSADDLRIVTRTRVTRGDRVRIALDVSELGLAIDAEVTAVEVETDSLGVRSCTLEFDQLDRVTRATILRHVMEQERRDRSRARRVGSMAPMRIGVIGLGTMGAPMARHLLEAGHTVAVHNRTRERELPLAELGADARANRRPRPPRDADAVLTCVSDSPDLEQVLFGPGGVAEGIAARRRWWSTARPSRRRSPAELAGAAGRARASGWSTRPVPAARREPSGAR